MDFKIVKEFENFIGQLQPTLSKVEKHYNNQATAVEQNCMNRSNNQENKFVECMIKKNEAYKKAFRQLEYHIAYWKNTTYECFEKSPQDTTKCKTEASTILQQYIDKCLKDV